MSPHLPSDGPRALVSVKMATYSELANRPVLTQPVYEAGRPIEVVAREFGLDPGSVIKLASNENPLGPSPLGLAAGRKALEQAHLYPDGGCTFLREKLAAKWRLKPSNFVIGNGSNEVMILLAQAFLRPGEEVVFGSQAFVVYKLVTLMFGATPVEVPLGPGFRQDLGALAAAVTPRTRLVFLASPANPLGVANTEEEIVALARSLPEHVILVFDEAYAEYLEKAPDLRPLLAEGRKVIGLRTFSKIYGLAALRVGYGYGASELIAIVQRARQPFNVSAIAAAAATAALDDDEFVTRCRAANAAGLAELRDGFARLGLEQVAGHGNFILVKVGDGPAVFDALQRRGLITRPVKSYGLPEWLRVSVGTSGQNRRLLETLAEVLKSR